MDAVILAALVIGLAAFVAAPLYRTPSPKVADHDLLRATFEATIESLRQLDADEHAGLSSPQDTIFDRNQLETRAAEALRSLEGDQPERPND